MNGTQAHSSAVEQSYQERQQAYLRWAVNAEYQPGNGVSDVFTQIPRLALGRGPLDHTMLGSSIDLIHARRDCADFALSGLLRILHLYPDSPLISATLHAQINEAVLKFCYWYDQPGVRGMCFHTENHQILFHACELLAGQLFPQEVFVNSRQTGEWHQAHAAEMIGQWMDHRARFGFAEWLSNCYFDEDLLALLNLADFARDPIIQGKARGMVDLLMLEMAMHQYKGVLATTHGRTYAPMILGGRKAPTSSIIWMVFGQGEFFPKTSFTLTSLCTSSYRCPPVLRAIAGDRPAEITLRERHGLNVADAPNHGLDTNRLSDNMFFWACQTARHPAVRQTAFEVARIADHPWLTDFISEADRPVPVSQELIESGGGVFDGEAVNTALSEANLITFRTPDYQLSCAQNFRPGKPGYQQHVWQAALDPDAVVFTTHPGTDDEKGDHPSRPNFWAGNRWLPRAGQHRSVLVCIHHVPADDPRPYSHAYFPRQAFNQVQQRENWIFGQKGSGYVALYSQHPARWAEAGPYAGVELRASSPDNIWVCEMGSAAQNDSIEQFIQAVLAAPIQCDGLTVSYHSPTCGEVRFGWADPLTVNGQEIQLHGYPRFDNPYIQAEINDLRYTVKYSDENLELDFAG